MEENNSKKNPFDVQDKSTVETRQKLNPINFSAINFDDALGICSEDIMSKMGKLLREVIVTKPLKRGILSGADIVSYLEENFTYRELSFALTARLIDDLKNCSCKSCDNLRNMFGLREYKIPMGNGGNA